MDIAELYKTQISLTEWFERIGHEKTQAIRAEDNDKRERLRVLHEIIGLPYDAPHQFPARDVRERTDDLAIFVQEHGSELCALRLVPYDPALPKLRMRGMRVKDVLEWFDAQAIDPLQYRADFIPHAQETRWSTIFVVNDHGIFGEIIRGGHHQLTQGFYSEHTPAAFTFDGEKFSLKHADENAMAHLETVVSHIVVPDENIQAILYDRLGGRFARTYLKGYFETVDSDEFCLWFIDWSPLLGSLYDGALSSSLQHEATDTHRIVGQTGSPGKIVGRARLLSSDGRGEAMGSSDDIIVCIMTTPEYIPFIQRARGVITDLGGVLSHAAIVCRELGKPCIVGTKRATKIIRDGQMIELDANRGVVTIL